MINELHLANYRGFEDYRLSSLARVNLLVGKNNSGKTSILEAIHILASQGNPWILAGISERRGEMIAIDEGGRDVYPNMSHFFHGHEIRLHDSFKIESSPILSPVRMEIVSWNDLDKDHQIQLQNDLHIRRMLFEETTGRRGSQRQQYIVFAPEEVFVLRLDANPDPPWLLVHPISVEGALLLEGGPYRQLGKRKDDPARVQFITQESLAPRRMSELWDRTILEGRKAEAIEAMRILDPKLVDIVFLSGEGAFRNGRSGILIAYEDTKRQLVPLGSLGEGMRRLLALALSLNRAQNGIILIDEIDTGLHYSVLGDMWHLIVSTAVRHGIQVFATTHSLDCIRGLAWLCEAHPDLAGEVSVQKLDRRLDEAVALDGTKIRIAVDQDIEVR